jgi:hypothetical protein
MTLRTRRDNRDIVILYYDYEAIPCCAGAMVEGKRRSHGSGECVMELSVGSG